MRKLALHGRLALPARLVSLVALAMLAIGPLALTAAAAGPLTMTARVMLQGHARAGSWTAIEVSLQNDGPAVRGELQMDGGDQARARYAMAVDLPTGSRQTYVLHAQPPVFGRSVKVNLVQDGQVLQSADVAYIVHDQSQLIVGVIAERPQGLVSELDLPPAATGGASVVVPLTLADLPQRAEGWSALDRLVWQDVDSNQLTKDQLAALRRWIAAGGRLVIVGGSAGIGTLSGFPDDMLPYRPTATLDLDPSNLTPLLGDLPSGATTLPAMGGALAHGRALVTSGDRVAAAELAYGSGRVTVLGFDPATKWLAESKSVLALWRGLLPPRSSDGTQLGDDSQLVQAIYTMPSLALPPITGLLAILAAYVVIIGPLNYLILRKLDRRELAWISMPVLVLGFTGVSYGYGAVLRGTDVVVNQVAIVRGAPDATEATAQVYFGVFSPNRATYLVQVADGALLASPTSPDPFGSDTGTLDIVQGTGPEQPSEVRNLTVGTTSLRTIRAQVATQAPKLHVSLQLTGDTLTGSVENDSDEPFEQAAVVLGGSATNLGDIAPHASATVHLGLQSNQFGAGLADQVIGSSFDQSSEAGIRRSIRYSMINQLTFDPTGMTGGQLSADQAVVLGFGRSSLLGVEVSGQQPRELANVLYYVPVAIGLHGNVTFGGDLLRPTVVNSDAQFFSKDRTFLNMGAGTATLAYRPIPFDGTFAVSEIRMTLGQGGGAAVGGGKEIEPLQSVPPSCTDATNSVPKGCQAKRQDFLPEVEVFDRMGGGAWVRLPRMSAELAYRLADPSRYVDPASGQLLVRFVNDSPDAGLGFSFQVALVGTIS